MNKPSLIVLEFGPYCAGRNDRPRSRGQGPSVDPILLSEYVIFIRISEYQPSILTVPPVVGVIANLESMSITPRFIYPNLFFVGVSSLGQLPYRLAKPILESCSPELLAKLEQEFTEWQAVSSDVSFY